MEHIVLVTGATAGFGEATARRFLAHGHKVIAVGRRMERLDVLKTSLPADQQKKLHILALDFYLKVVMFLVLFPFMDITSKGL
jgi:3-hydroxy acid dehydrogenase/malonic semialdehyde reductase